MKKTYKNCLRYTLEVAHLYQWFFDLTNNTIYHTPEPLPLPEYKGEGPVATLF